MNSFRPELLKSVQSKLGMPFAEHFQPNECQGGVLTLDSCMEKGLDAQRGYDCSGLIIASLCEVLEISTAQWPHEFRHAVQMRAVATGGTQPKRGDVVYMSHPEKSWYKHLGVMSDPHKFIHATPYQGDGHQVVESYVDYQATRLAVVEIDRIIGTLDT